jgi:hypothetical protein
VLPRPPPPQTHSVWKKLKVLRVFLLVEAAPPPELPPPGELRPPWLRTLPATDGGRRGAGSRPPPLVLAAPMLDRRLRPAAAAARPPPALLPRPPVPVDGDGDTSDARRSCARLVMICPRGVTSRPPPAVGDWSSCPALSAPPSLVDAAEPPPLLPAADTTAGRLSRSVAGGAWPRGAGGARPGGPAAPARAALLAGRAAGTLNPPSAAAAAAAALWLDGSGRLADVSRSTPGGRAPPPAAAAARALSAPAPRAGAGAAAEPTRRACSRWRPSSLSPSVSAAALGRDGAHVTGSTSDAPGARWADQLSDAAGGCNGSSPRLKPSATGTLWATSSCLKGVGCGGARTTSEPGCCAAHRNCAAAPRPRCRLLAALPRRCAVPSRAEAAQPPLPHLGRGRGVLQLQQQRAGGAHDNRAKVQHGALRGGCGRGRGRSGSGAAAAAAAAVQVPRNNARPRPRPLPRPARGRRCRAGPPRACAGAVSRRHPPGARAPPPHRRTSANCCTRSSVVARSPAPAPAPAPAPRSGGARALGGENCIDQPRGDDWSCVSPPGSRASSVGGAMVGDPLAGADLSRLLDARHGVGRITESPTMNVWRDGECGEGAGGRACGNWTLNTPAPRVSWGFGASAPARKAVL